MTFSQLLPSHENEIPKRISFPSFFRFETPRQSQHCLISTFFFTVRSLRTTFQQKRNLLGVYIHSATRSDLKNSKFCVLFFTSQSDFLLKATSFFIYFIYTMHIKHLCGLSVKAYKIWKITYKYWLKDSVFICSFTVSLCFTNLTSKSFDLSNPY